MFGGVRELESGWESEKLGMGNLRFVGMGGEGVESV